MASPEKLEATQKLLTKMALKALESIEHSDYQNELVVTPFSFMASLTATLMSSEYLGQIIDTQFGGHTMYDNLVEMHMKLEQHIASFLEILARIHSTLDDDELDAVLNAYSSLGEEGSDDSSKAAVDQILNSGFSKN